MTRYSKKYLALFLGLTLGLSGCFSPDPKAEARSAEQQVLSLLETQNYALLSERDKAAGTAEEFAKLSPYGAAEVVSSPTHKYYELETFLIERSGFQISSAEYDPATGKTTVVARWEMPKLLRELYYTPTEDIMESSRADLALERFEAGKIDTPVKTIRTVRGG